MTRKEQGCGTVQVAPIPPGWWLSLEPPGPLGPAPTSSNASPCSGEHVCPGCHRGVLGRLPGGRDQRLEPRRRAMAPCPSGRRHRSSGVRDRAPFSAPVDRFVTAATDPRQERGSVRRSCAAPHGKLPHEDLVDFSQPFGDDAARKSRARSDCLGSHHRAARGLLRRPPRFATSGAPTRSSSPRPPPCRTTKRCSTPPAPTGPARSLFEICRIWPPRCLRADRQALDRCFLSDTHGVPWFSTDTSAHRKKWLRSRRAARVARDPVSGAFGALMPVSEHSDFNAVAFGGGDGLPGHVGATGRERGGARFAPGLAHLAISLPDCCDSARCPRCTSAVLRDLRLMQATPEGLPPRELRVGIERMYMLRLRAALDRAPRASRRTFPSSAARVI